METLWSLRQERARVIQAEAAARIAQSLLDAADSPTMMVRTVSFVPVPLSELVPGKRIDDEVLESGDFVLLNTQHHVVRCGLDAAGERY